MIVYPINDAERLTFLRTALAIARQDQALGRSPLSQETIEALQTEIEHFEAATQQVVQAKVACSQASEAVNQAIRELEIQGRRIWSIASWQTALTQAQTVVDELTSARQNLRLAQKELTARRTSITKQTWRTVQNLRYALQDKPRSLQREIMRTYGVHFRRSDTAQKNGAETDTATARVILTDETPLLGW